MTLETTEMVEEAVLINNFHKLNSPKHRAVFLFIYKGYFYNKKPLS